MESRSVHRRCRSVWRAPRSTIPIGSRDALRSGLGSEAYARLVDVCPSLTYRDLEAAVVFLERAFGLELEEAVTDEGGKFRLVTMRQAMDACCCSLIFPMSCTEATSGTAGSMLQCPTPTHTSRRPWPPALTCSVRRTMRSTGRNAAIALVTSRAISGASGLIVPASD